VTVNNVAYFDGGVWHAFTDTGNTNTGTDGPVYAIANDGYGDYYFGGVFTAPRQNLVYFDGYDFFAGWSAPNALVRTIALLGNDVYIGGQFTNAAGSGADYIAVSKNGSDWQPLGSSLNNPVNALLVRGNTLYAAGAFTQSGALGLNYIAAWDPSAQSWSNLGSGLDDFGVSLAASPNFIYVGGGFANAGAKPSQYLGRYGQYELFLPVTMK
jgi:trimeric autotransporter adhesin